jgi:hypothetical protein
MSGPDIDRSSAICTLRGPITEGNGFCGCLVNFASCLSTIYNQYKSTTNSIGVLPRGRVSTRDGQQNAREISYR